MNNWKRIAESLHDSGELTWRGIARLLNVPRSTVSDHLRKYAAEKDYQTYLDSYKSGAYGKYYDKIVFEPLEQGAKKWDQREDATEHLLSSEKNAERLKESVGQLRGEKEDNSVILVISDMHVPYCRKELIPFLTEVKEKYNPTRVICIGDEIDHHAMSFHDSDPDLFSAGHELEEAKKIIKQVEALFPTMDLIDSNHGSMAYRKAKHHGVPRSYIKSYNEVLGVGEGWKWHNDLTITLPNGQPCYFHHGKVADGLKLSQAMGMNCVQGHHHEKFNASYWSNPLGLYFSMQVGCLIDDNSYAFAYNNVNIKRPVIGLGLIIDSHPVLVPMKL